MIPGHSRLRDQYSDADDQPVIRVNWHEARLFCRWRGAAFRLPAEEEWERAASWDHVAGVKREYPWGDEFDLAKCNTIEARLGKTTQVGAYPRGASAYGCFDMAGNVWEWTESLYSETEEYRVLRGGSWNFLVATPHAPIAATNPRAAVTSMWGFVAPGHNLTLYPFPSYSLYSLSCTL